MFTMDLESLKPLQNTMKSLFAAIVVVISQLLSAQLAYAYLLPVSGYEDEGRLYIDTDSIQRGGRYVTLSYVESFNQPKSYGSLSYLSKATNIRLDCAGKRVFALGESFYSEPNLSGRMLGQFALNDQTGSVVEDGSWVAEILRLGCSPRRY